MHITHYDNPHEQIDDQTVKQLTAAAQSAFDRDGMPTEDDVRDHIDVDRLLTAERDGEIVGFSATETYEVDDTDLVYAAGLAVREDEQGQGIGSLLRVRGILDKMGGDQAVVTTRTQNPAVVSYFDDYFDAYPKLEGDETTPERLEQAVEAFADKLDSDASFDYPVMEKAYPGSMYESLPDHPLTEAVEETLDYRQWRCAASRRGSRPAPAGTGARRAGSGAVRRAHVPGRGRASGGRRHKPAERRRRHRVAGRPVTPAVHARAFKHSREGDSSMPEIDPWGDVQAGNYKQKMEKFGIDPFDDHADKLPELNRYMRRGILYGQRDFGTIAEAVQDDEPFAMMTGLMPSGTFHFGHKMVADQMLYYQELGAELYIAVADIEAYATRDMSLEKAREIAINQYLTNYIALGLEPDNVTFYFQSEGPTHYNTMSKLFSRHVTQSEVEAVYGDVSPGKVTAALTQVADILQPQFEENGGPKPVVVPVGTDQDPHIRLTRDIAARFPSQDFIKPAATYHKFMRGLQGGKMSSSKPNSYIALTDSVKDAKEKIDRAKTGGQQSLEEHREHGADVEEDMVYELLAFHLIEDDDRLEEIYRQYDSGEMLSGELKQIAKDRLETFLEEHQAKREQAKQQLDAFLQDQ